MWDIELMNTETGVLAGVLLINGSAFSLNEISVDEKF